MKIFMIVCIWANAIGYYIALFKLNSPGLAFYFFVMGLICFTGWVTSDKEKK